MFNTKIPLYGIIIIISIILGLINIYIRTKKFEFTKEERMAIILYIIIGVFFGSKLLTFILNFKKYNGFFDITKVGLSSYGGLIAMILMMLLFAIQFKKDKMTMLYIICSSVPLMYGIGKIGCFVAGCCYGIEYSGPLHIVYNYSLSAPKGVALFPVQICESITFLLIYLFIVKMENKLSKEYLVSCTFILGGLCKFIWDFFRYNPTNNLFTPNKIISLFFIILGFIIYIYYRFINKKNKVTKVSK